MTASELSVAYDPYAPELRQDPYPVYSWLREQAPLYRHPEKGFFALSRFADILEAIHDWETFSSAHGVTLEGVMTDVQPEMITMDPPRHDELRTLVKRAFTPASINALEPRVSEIATELVDALDPDDFDLVRDVGAIIPSSVIAELLGIPSTDRPLFREWIEVLIRRDTNVPETIAAAHAASAELTEYLVAAISARQQHTTDDLIGFLVSAAQGDSGMSDQELLGFVRLLLVAGNETTINLVGNAFLTLARHPDQRARIAGDRSLTPGAVEEVLRYESPVPALSRTVTRDVVLHGVDVPAGSVVLLVFAAGNRDEREFTHADQFDVTRRISRHLAFGHGIHHCLGAAVARLEARAAVDALLDRFPEYRLTTDQIEMVPSGHARGPERLPAAAL